MHKDKSINANRWNSNKYDKHINVLWPILVSIHLYWLDTFHLFFLLLSPAFSNLHSLLLYFFTLTLYCTSYRSSFKKPFYPRIVPINKLLPLYKRSWRSKRDAKYRWIRSMILLDLENSIHKVLYRVYQLFNLFINKETCLYISLIFPAWN